MVKELEKNLDKICDLKEKYTDVLQSVSSMGIESLDAQEVGEVADIIKDLAEAERNCLEACYYKTVIKAMEEKDYEEMGKYGYGGYPNIRYASMGYSNGGGGMSSSNNGGSSQNSGMSNGNGGRNGNYGYRPYLDQEPYIGEYLNNPNDFRKRMVMGYHDGHETHMPMDYYQQGGMMAPEGNSRNGRIYDSYRTAKKYYTESKSHSDKAEMEKYSKEYLMDAIDVFKEMWTDAEPQFRTKMKEDLTKLVSSLKE